MKQENLIRRSEILKKKVLSPVLAVVLGLTGVAALSQDGSDPFESPLTTLILEPDPSLDDDCATAERPLAEGYSGQVTTSTENDELRIIFPGTNKYLTGGSLDITTTRELTVTVAGPLYEAYSRLLSTLSLNGSTDENLLDSTKVATRTTDLDLVNAVTATTSLGVSDNQTKTVTIKNGGAVRLTSRGQLHAQTDYRGTTTAVGCRNDINRVFLPTIRNGRIIGK